MGRRTLCLSLLAPVTATLVVFGSGACRRKPARTVPARVTILYTGGVQGTLEPCGCSPGQLGGIARIATLVKQVRDETGAVVLVDAGNLLFQEAEVPASLREQLLMKAHFLQKAYGAMRVAVLNLGEHDLPGGPELPLRGAEEIGAVSVSSNLFRASAKRRTLTRAATIVNAGGARVAFIGAMAPGSLAGAVKETLRVEDPLNRVRVTVAQVRAEADVVVLLSTLGLAADRRLAAHVPGLDLVIDAGVRGEPHNVVIPEKAGGSLIVQVKTLGEYVGRIDIAPRSGETGGLRDATTSDRVRGLPAEEGAAGGGITFGKGLELRGAPERKRVAPFGAFPPLAPGTLRHTVYAVADRFAQDAGIQRLMNEYKSRVADLNRKASTTTSRIPTAGPTYVGEDSCKECHQEIYDFVHTTAHAHAYETLERKQSEFDLECVGCHVAGWRKPGGFDQPAAVGNLKNVQCEVCHGPASRHVREEGDLNNVGGFRAAVPIETCRTCHTQELGTRFAGNEAAYMDRIRCSRAILAGGPTPSGSVQPRSRGAAAP